VCAPGVKENLERQLSSLVKRPPLSSMSADLGMNLGCFTVILQGPRGV
jgi:hypothetical protein